MSADREKKSDFLDALELLKVVTPAVRVTVHATLADTFTATIFPFEDPAR